jgi:hypothetical protein
MQNAGVDVLFAQMDGVTILSNIVRRCNKQSGLFKAYVLLPEFLPFEDTDLYFFYGNQSASDQQDKSAFHRYEQKHTQLQRLVAKFFIVWKVDLNAGLDKYDL